MTTRSPVRLLERNDLFDNTIIIYTGDQDDARRTRLHGPTLMDDESLRMPFLMRYPKLIEPGSTNGDHQQH